MTFSLVQYDLEKCLKTSLLKNSKNISEELENDLKKALSIYKIKVNSVIITVMSKEYYKVHIRTDYKDYIYAVQLVFCGDVISQVNIL